MLKILKRSDKDEITFKAIEKYISMVSEKLYQNTLNECTYLLYHWKLCKSLLKVHFPTVKQ